MLLGLGLAVIGCTDVNEVEPGNYEARQVLGHDSADEAAILATELSIDRATATATFSLNDGTVINASFGERPRSEWPIGCPGLNTEMEILVLDEPTITIASLEIVDPVLIASCPGDSDEVVLSEDGTTRYGGGPCEERCVYFKPVYD